MSLLLWNLFFGTSRGKNALKKAYLQKILSFLDSELELLSLKIHYPEQFQNSKQQTIQSSLFVISKFPNLGIMGMTEILTALCLLGGIETREGKKPPTIALADVFEQAFGFSFNGIYDCQRELFKRKEYNLTKTLEALKNVLVKEYKKRKAEEAKKKKMKKDDFVSD